MKIYNWGKWSLVSKNSVRIAKKICAIATTEAERTYMLRKKTPETALAVRTILADFPIITGTKGKNETKR